MIAYAATLYAVMWSALVRAGGPGSSALPSIGGSLRHRRYWMPRANASHEPELLDRARRGDRAAFGGLVRLHQRRMYGCALQMLGRPGEADDAVQETFLRAWKAIGRFDGRSELSTWLYRICVNVCLNALRRRRRVEVDDLGDPRVPEPPVDPTQSGNDPHLHSETRQLQRRLAAALDGLSESLRTTVVLVLIQGLSHQQAGAVLGCPEGTVAWRIHEARRKLRAALADAEAAPGRDGPATQVSASSRAEVGPERPALEARSHARRSS